MRTLYLAIFVLAFGVRALYALSTDNREMGNWSDQGGAIALGMLEGRGYTYDYGLCQDFRSFRMPVLPLTLFAVWSVVGYNLLAAKLVMAAVSALTAVLIARLARLLYDDRAALLAGSIAALFPNFIYWTGTVGPETLTLFFAVACVLAFLVGLRGGRFIPAGVAASLLALTRPVYLPYGASLAAILLITGRGRRRYTAAFAFASAMALAFAPWVVRNWAVHRAFLATSTEGGLTFLECNNPESFHRADGDWVFGFAEKDPGLMEAAAHLSEVELDRRMYRMGLAYIRREPLMFARSFALRVGNLWRPFPRQGFSGKIKLVMGATWTPLFLLAGCTILGRRVWRDREHLPILLLIAWTTIAAGLVRSGIRYRAPIEPFIIIYAAAALAELSRRLRTRGAGRPPVAVPPGGPTP